MLGKFNTGKKDYWKLSWQFVYCLSLVDENFFKNDEDTSVNMKMRDQKFIFGFLKDDKLSTIQLD